MIRGVPYDAEVEYLESTGTQWIDTGMVPTVDDSFYCRIKQSVVRDQCLWGLAGVVYCFSNKGVGAGNGTFWGHPAIGQGGVQNVNPLGDTDWHEILCQPSGVFVDGVQINTQVTGLAQSPLNTVALFARAVNSAGGDVAKNGQGRISAFNIEHNGTPVRDFVPVRFTNEQGQSEGAMYDRVTRRLFRNQGTGAFQWGPDVATPVMGLHMYQKPPYTARDYVQDGLIAMWDGIENAGWGVHDPSATVWVNLAGGSIGNIALYTQNCEWASDALIGKERSFVDSSTVLALGTCPMPNDYSTCELVLKAGNSTFVVFSKGTLSEGNAAVGRFRTDRELQLAFVNGTGGGVVHSANTRYYAARTGSSFVEGGETYKNGARSSLLHSRTAISGANRFGEGYRTNASNASPFVGELCAMRFHSRALTAAEIAHNYTVDKERFKLP